MLGLKEFKAAIHNDSALRENLYKLNSVDEIYDFATTLGYSFSDEEIEMMTEVSQEDISKVYGGVTRDMQNVQPLVSVNRLMGILDL